MCVCWSVLGGEELKHEGHMRAYLGWLQTAAVSDDWPPLALPGAQRAGGRPAAGPDRAADGELRADEGHPVCMPPCPMLLLSASQCRVPTAPECSYSTGRNSGCVVSGAAVAAAASCPCQVLVLLLSAPAILVLLH